MRTTTLIPPTRCRRASDHLWHLSNIDGVERSDLLKMLTIYYEQGRTDYAETLEASIELDRERREMN